MFTEYWSKSWEFTIEIFSQFVRWFWKTVILKVGKRGIFFGTRSRTNHWINMGLKFAPEVNFFPKIRFYVLFFWKTRAYGYYFSTVDIFFSYVRTTHWPFWLSMLTFIWWSVWICDITRIHVIDVGIVPA